MKNRALVFIRSIQNYDKMPLTNKNEINLVKKFIELDEDNQIDAQIESKISELKNKVYQTLPKSSIFNYKVTI